jgi:hypothetical protein
MGGGAISRKVCNSYDISTGFVSSVAAHSDLQISRHTNDAEHTGTDNSCACAPNATLLRTSLSRASSMRLLHSSVSNTHNQMG